MPLRVPAELVERDPRVLAPSAGLEYVPDDEPGIRRLRCGRGFSYRGSDGRVVRGAARTRLEALAVPPAWSDVWMAPVERGYLQASGYDDAERKQYRYHDEYRAFAERRKFERLRYFGRALTPLRKATVSGLDADVGTRECAVAAALRLLDTGLLRVGNERSADRGHHGASTLGPDHVDVDGDLVEVEFIGKSGAERQVVVHDPELARILESLADDADEHLFWYDVEADDTDRDTGRDTGRRADGRARGTTARRRVTADDVNEFIAEVAGPAFSARDFRTWGGSRRALAQRANGDDLLDAIDETAEELGNTRAVARASYIHPDVLSADIETIRSVWRSSRSGRWLDREDSALVKLLGSPTS